MNLISLIQIVRFRHSSIDALEVNPNTTIEMSKYANAYPRDLWLFPKELVFVVYAKTSLIEKTAIIERRKIISPDTTWSRVLMK